MNGNGTIQMPPQASTIASDVDALYYFIFWGCTFFFVLIVALSIFFIIRYRRTPDRELKPRAYHNTPLELTWTIVPTILVMVVFVWGFKGFMHLSVAPANSLEYHVTGKRWLWEVRDPNGVASVNEMSVPVNQPVKLILKSEDLIHSFFVPAFRIKQDVIPNRYNTMWFEATMPGDYDLFCTEYCGTGHSTMLGKVHVLTEEEWKEYQEKSGGKQPDETLAEYGRRLYQGRACVTCHSLDGSKMTGPSFQGIFGHEVDLADGSRVTVDENYIRQSIMEPKSQVVAGFEPVMPTYTGLLSPDDIDALVEFIKEQK